MIKPLPRSRIHALRAGTLVHTIDGLRPIESIRVRDRVLSQKTSTGALGFQPDLAVRHTKAAPTVRVARDGETTAATGTHHFWGDRVAMEHLWKEFHNC